MSQTSTSSAFCILVTCTIYASQHSLPVQVLVDTGTDDNFIDSDFVSKHNLSVYKIVSPKEVHAIDGTLLETVTHKTEPLE